MKTSWLFTFYSPAALLFYSPAAFLFSHHMDRTIFKSFYSIEDTCALCVIGLCLFVVVQQLLPTWPQTRCRTSGWAPAPIRPSSSQTPATTKPRYRNYESSALSCHICLLYGDHTWKKNSKTTATKNTICLGEFLLWFWVGFGHFTSFFAPLHLF